MSSRQLVAVVGVDGSAPSMRAARWAADEAEYRRLSLRLLYCTSGLTDDADPIVDPDFSDEPGNCRAEAMLDVAARSIARSHPRLDILTMHERGDPRRILVKASQRASLLVLGTRSGRLLNILLESVPLDLIGQSESPVVVIPEDCQQREGPIVVGVDGSGANDGAIGFAMDEATIRGVGVVGILATGHWPNRDLWGEPSLIDPANAQPEHALIAEEFAGWRQKYPDVPVHHHVFRGNPADCLLGYAGHARPELRPQMVVVGSRGRGPVAGLLLGSTGHALIARSDRPIVVVRRSV